MRMNSRMGAQAKQKNRAGQAAKKIRLDGLDLCEPLRIDYLVNVPLR